MKRSYAGVPTRAKEYSSLLGHALGFFRGEGGRGGVYAKKPKGELSLGG